MKKLFKHVFLILILVLLFPFQVHAQTKLPTVQSAETRLADEIQKMLDAGHLRPAYYNANEFYWQRAEGITVNKTSSHYWANPAETIYTLLRALPHVSDSMKPTLRTYIQNEWNTYPPTTYSHAGWNGAAREIFDLPDEAFNGPISNYPEGNMSPGTHDAFAWSGYSFNPFNIYASYLYAKEFGGATPILDSIRTKVAPLPDDSFLDLTGHPKAHLLNMYIASYYGYLGLQDLAGETKSSTVQGYLTSALSKRIEILSVSPVQYEGTETGGFLYLVPELANYLNQNAKTQVTNFINQHEPLMPYWFVSRVDEATRVHHYYVAPRHESSISQYYDYSSLFNAKALVLKVSRVELEKYLDVPATYRGDLYHIQNLVSTIEASGTSPSVPPQPTSTQTPLPTITPSEGGNLLAGTGQAVFNTSNGSLPDTTTLDAMIVEAVAEARTAYGTGTPKAVLFINNAGGVNSLITAIKNEFGSSLPIGGVGTGFEGYNSFTMESFVEPPNRSLTVLAIGGDAITKVVMVQDGTISQGGDETNVRETGRIIAQGLLPHFDAGKKNIVHMFGAGHNPNHIIILEGMKEIIGDPVPNHIKIIGAAGSNSANSTANGNLMNNSVTGVLIQGNFEYSLRGVGQTFGGDPVQVSTQLMNEVKNELGGNPQLVFYVPGHPDDEGATFESMRQAAIGVFGLSTPLFGHEGGGEYGHITTSGQPLADIKTFFVMGIRASGSTSLQGDINGDGVVNVLDFTLLSNAFGINDTSADINNDGVVNVLDFTILSNNFGQQS